jgi:hypothetical protein
MNFSMWMPKTEQAARNRWHGVALIVHPRKLRDFGVKKGGPGLIPDARLSKRGTLNRRPFREIKLHE